MNRRSFLGLLGVAPVAVAAAPSVVAGTGTLFNPVSPIQDKKPMRYSMLGDPDILRAQHKLNRIATLHQEELQERYFRPAAEAIHQAMLADHGKRLVAFGGIL